jgi:hypothetical protein
MEHNRAWNAGQEMGKAIIEMVHLMYQNQTALAFIRALSIQINTERNRREDEREEEKDEKHKISDL